MEIPESAPTSALARLARVARWARARWGILVAVGAPIVTVATIVIPVIADASVRMTSVETLAIETSEMLTAEPSTEQASDTQAAVAGAPVAGFGSIETISISPLGRDRDWRVRSDAPWDTFPGTDPGSPYGCSPAQLAWLEQWGRRKALEVWNGYLTMSNTASDGASMSLRNLRSVGVFVVPEVPEVEVVCGGGMGGGEDIIVVEHVLGSPEPATLFNEHDGMPPGSPAVVNIAPGQYVQLLANLIFPAEFDHADFTGDFVADLTIGDTTTTVTLFEGLTRVSPPEISTVSLQIFGTDISCFAATYTRCTIAEFVQYMQADPGFTR